MLPVAEGTERFGQRLRRMRERAGLTQEELAERARLSLDAVSALERGSRTRPYPQTVRALADALGLHDDDRASLLEAVPARTGAQRPAGAAAEPVEAPGILAVPPTTLVGRDDDVRAVVHLVRSGARLVTLTGPGGVGKTRLLAAVTQALEPEVVDGVTQVPLAPLLEPTALVPTVGLALGLAGADGPRALDVVVEHLHGRQVLLVLDNFEHLLGAAADVATLVSTCPGVVVLTSSRAPLRVRGEHEYPVPPLALPPEDVTTEEDLRASAAGALVLDRARQVMRAPLSPDDVRHLAELCRRTAGIPLAIELATARLRLLDPGTLLRRLDAVLSAEGPRDLPARQRTMRATLDWSYGLLAREERTLFRLLASFRGGATLEAVETVVAEAAQPSLPDVLGALEGLVEHSLVVVRDGPDEHRFTMLEPVAQYAREQLTGEEAVRAARAHAAYYAERAELAADGYEREDQVLWLGRTETDEANLAVAVDRSLAAGDAATAGRIVWSMWLYWWLRGQFTYGRRKAEECLRGDLPVDLRGRVRLAAATMAYAGGDTDAAAEHWRAAWRHGEEVGDARVLTAARAGAGLVALNLGDLAQAGAAFQDAIRLADDGEGLDWLASIIHGFLATVLLLRGDVDGAVREAELALASATDRGDRLVTYVALYNLSQAAILTGDHDRARRHLQEGIRLSAETEDRANLTYFLDAVAVVEAHAGDPRRVAALIGAAQALREGVGADVYGYYRPDPALREAASRSAATALGALGFAEAQAYGRSLDFEAAVSYALGDDERAA